MVSDVAYVARNWWMFAVLGVVCIVTGVLAIVWPGLAPLALGILVHAPSRSPLA